MSGYVFVSNSTKPTVEKQKSREPIKLENVNRPCLQTALEMNYDVYFGVNRENPEDIECELPVHLYDSHTYRSRRTGSVRAITICKNGVFRYDSNWTKN